MYHLQKFLLILAVSFLLLLSAASNSFTQTNELKAIAGTWDIEVVDQGMFMEFVFELKGDSLSGMLVFEMGDGEMTDIEFKENVLTFSVSLDGGGMTIDVDVEATVDGDEMSGTLDSDMGSADFSGTKRKDKKSETLFYFNPEPIIRIISYNLF